MGNRRSKTRYNKLSEKEIQMLLHKTVFSREEILEWHKTFLENHPDGFLNYDEFSELYLGIINPQDKSLRYGKILFKAFDVEKRGKISLREFLILTVFQTDDDNQMSLEKVDEKSFELALALWYANGNFSQEKLESVRNALTNSQKSQIDSSSESSSSEDDDNNNYEKDPNVHKDELNRIVRSCKIIITK